MKRVKSCTRIGARNALSALLSFALVVSGVPAQAYASETNEDQVVYAEAEQPGLEPQYQQDADLQSRDDQTTDAATNAAVPEASFETDETPDVQAADVVAPEASPEADEAPDAQAADAHAQGSQSIEPEQRTAHENEPTERLEGHLHLIHNGEDPYASDETSPLAVTPGLEGKLTEERYQTIKSTFSRTLANHDDKRVDMRPYHLTYDEAAAIAEEVINSNPNFWYVAAQFWCDKNPDGTLVDIGFAYHANKETVRRLQSKYVAALGEAVSWIPQNASTAEKVKAAHDWLVRNVAYNEAAGDLGPYAYAHTVENSPWSAYGTLVAKSAVCQGYSLAFSAILNAVGIESDYVHVDEHVWNRVLVDGSWYHVDLTWDDPTPDGGFDPTPSTEYFLKSDEGLRAIGDKTHQKWWLPAPACSSTKYDDKKTDWPTYREPAKNEVNVESFDLSSATLVLGMNEYAKLEVINRSPAEATTHGATWTSSNEDVALVDSSGGVYARDTAGTTTITCTVGGTTRTCEVTVRVTVDYFDLWTPDYYDISRLECEFKGSACEPEPVVEFGGKSLKLGTDYTLSYRDNVNAGTATMVITGMGDYSGSRTVPFKIAPADIAKATVASMGSEKYTGSAIEPAPVVTFGSAALVAGTDYTVTYDNNVNVGTAAVTIAGKGNYTGSKVVTFDIVASTLEVYRLYNPNSGEHFYTAKAGERDALVGLGWVYEGVGWTAPATSGTPVYRLYNPVAGDHHYTAKDAEKDALVGAGWKYEGIGWYSDAAEGVPIYRQYNPYAVSGSHNYTANKKENDALVGMGWKDEGICWYGVKQ